MHCRQLKVTMDDWMLSPTFSSSSPPSLQDSTLSSEDRNTLKELLGNPPTFMSTSSVPLGVGPQSFLAKRRLQGIGPDLLERCFNQYPYLGLVLAECHFSLNDINGALEWCQKVKALLSSKDQGLQTAIDFLQQISSAELDSPDEDEEVTEGYTVQAYSRPGILGRVEDDQVLSLSTETKHKLAELRASEKDAAAQFSRLACVSSNEIEGIFSLTGNSISSLVKRGFLENAITGISLSSRIKKKSTIVKILENAMKCISKVGHAKDIDEALVLDLHETLLEDDFIMDSSEYGESFCYIIPRGQFRTSFCYALRDIDMKEVRFCPARHIPGEMAWFYPRAEEVLSREDICPFHASAWLQWAFLRIHPFGDGNGRVSRMISSIPLMKVGLPPVIVTMESKQNYFKAIKTCDDTHDVGALAHFLCDELTASVSDLHTMTFGGSKRDLKAVNVARLKHYIEKVPIVEKQPVFWGRDSDGKPTRFS